MCSARPAPRRSIRTGSIARWSAPRPIRDCCAHGFDQIVQFVATGGYALANYERYAKLKKTPEGLWRVAHPRIAQQYRLNVGTIVEAPMVRVRLARLKGGALKPSSMLAGGRVLGEVEEYFIEQLTPGDSFVFAGQVLQFEGLRENDAIVTRAHATEPKVPAYEGGKFPLSTYLAERVRNMLAAPATWSRLPDQVSDWLRLQAEFSVVPGPNEVLIETFPRGQKHYLICYPFEGRLAHQSLGMLLTRRLERAGASPLGFVANEYALAIWALKDMGEMVRDGRLDLARLFDEDMLGDDLDAWLAEFQPDEALVQGLRHHLRPDRAAASRTGEDQQADDGLLRSDLRCAAAARAGPYPAQGRVRRCGDGTHRCRPARRFLAANRRANQAYWLAAGLAARRAGHAGDRARERAGGSERGLVA